MMLRKAQGLSITTIIVALIALIVLVIIISIFTGRMGIFGKGLDEAGEIGGKCPGDKWKDECDDATEYTNYAIIGKGENADKVCCVEKPK
jgi:hypothetical protein